MTRKYELLFKYLWILVIVPKPVQFVLLSVYLLYLLKDNWKEIKLDKISILILAYTGVHAISIVLAVIRGGYIPNRLLAAINTCLIWIVAAGLYTAYSNSKTEVNSINKYCFINSAIMITLSVLARVIHAFGMDTFFIPWIGYLFSQEVYYSRLVAFLDYPTLIVAFSIIMLPGALEHIKDWMGHCDRRLIIIVQLAYYLLAFLPIRFSYSRAGYVLYFLGTVVVLLYLTEIKPTLKQVLLFVIISLDIILLMAIYTSIFIDVYDYLMVMRSGSNSTRMTIYKETFQAFLQHPVLGNGIKRMCTAINLYPLGSHSTYLGFLYKTGIIGTAVIMYAIFKMIYNLVSILIRGEASIRLYACFLMMIFAFTILEDLDGANWFVCLFFSIYGLVQNKQILKSEIEETKNRVEVKNYEVCN